MAGEGEGVPGRGGVAGEGEVVAGEGLAGEELAGEGWLRHSKVVK
jgi:hypothetical protein